MLIGLQLRAVDSFVLTQEASNFIAEKQRQAQLSNANPYDYQPVLLSAGPVPKRVVRPNRWLGWALLSVGAVMCLHGSTIRYN
jgi:hypothetical protein